jgi:large subunit ribosomal protein L21
MRNSPFCTAIVRVFATENERSSAMFVVISDGSRQYRVQEGDTLFVDYREGAEEGTPLRFEQVLLANAGGASSIGTPVISGALVEATVVDPEVKGIKLEIGKFRRRKNSRRHTGHRQKYTSVKITSITVPGLQVVEKTAEQKAAEQKPVEKKEKPAKKKEQKQTAPGPVA